MSRFDKPHLNMPIVSKSELRRVTIQTKELCDECRTSVVLGDHRFGFCACECHLSDGDLAYLKWFTRDREGE